MSIASRAIRRPTSMLAGVAVIAALSLTATGCGGGSSGSAVAGSKLTIGELFPFTGSKAQLSTWGTQGVNTGIYEINHNGGVLGHMLQVSSGDDAADPVDALPALRKLFLTNPVAVVGPFSPTIEAVINQFGANKVVDFMIGGTTQLDHMQFPYVFRTTASDATEAVAMATYAKNKGYMTASLIFDNSANSQGFVAPLEKSYQKQGGKILANEVIVPGQSSYRSELLKAFSGHPQVIFCSFDTQTASTLWNDAQQIGYLNEPWVGDDLESSAVYAKAFGPKASTNLVSAVASAPSGTAYDHFLADYQAVYHTSQSLPTTYNEYDALVIAALAMTKANSTDPSVWYKDIAAVASPPGTKCYDYAGCRNLINAGTKINFDGAGGNDDFNAYHNVFSGFSIEGFTASNANKIVAQITPAELSANAG